MMEIAAAQAALDTLAARTALESMRCADCGRRPAADSEPCVALQPSGSFQVRPHHTYQLRRAEAKALFTRISLTDEPLETTGGDTDFPSTLMTTRKTPSEGSDRVLDLTPDPTHTSNTSGA